MYITASLLLFYCLISVYIAFFNKKPSRPSLVDYALGYPSISLPVLSSGILATALGSGSTIGKVGAMFSIGLSFIIVQALLPFSWYISSKIFSRNLESFKNCLSLSHVVDYSYGNSAKWIATVLTLIAEMGVIVAQIIAIAYVLSNIFSLSIDASYIVSFMMVMGFSLMGGIRTIAQTGVLQFSLFFLLFPISYTIISYKYGGISNLNEQLPLSLWRAEDIKTSTLIYLAIFSLLPECSSSFIQKCLIARDKEKLETSLKAVGMIYIPIMLSLWFIAYTIKVTAPDIAPDTALLYYITNMCPDFLKALVSVGLIAIIMGMSDGILHSCSVIFANDIVKVLRPKTSEKALIYSAKFAIVIMCVSAFLLISQFRNIMDIFFTVDSIWTPLMLIPLYAAFGGFNAHKNSFLSSAITASVAISIGYYVGLESMEVLMIGLIASSIGFFGGHIIMSKISLSQIQLAALEMLSSWANSLYVRFLVILKKIDQDLFPKEEKMLLWQKQIYGKFSMCMLALFFIYSILMEKGEYYGNLTVMLVLGYVLTTLLMVRSIIFKHISSKVFYALWYSTIITWSITSCYGLLSGNPIMVTTGAIALLFLLVFTNAVTYLFSLLVGFSVSYTLFTGEISYQYYLIGLICTIVGYFFSRPQEELVHDKVSGLEILIGTIAHELRSPQAATEMSLEMAVAILSDVKRTKKGDTISLTFDAEELSMLETFVSNARKSTKEGIKVVEMLLLGAKTSNANLAKNIFSVHACASKAVDDYIAANKSAASKIKLDIDKSWEVDGPEDHVNHVIHNIVRNSFVHGGGADDLLVKVYQEGNKLIIEDNGVGIPREHLPFIFDRFFSKSDSGTGIGLAFCKNIIEGMGGTIRCESRVGKGSYTKFIISMP